MTRDAGSKQTQRDTDLRLHSLSVRLQLSSTSTRSPTAVALLMLLERLQRPKDRATRAADQKVRSILQDVSAGVALEERQFSRVEVRVEGAVYTEDSLTEVPTESMGLLPDVNIKAVDVACINCS